MEGLVRKRRFLKGKLTRVATAIERRNVTPLTTFLKAKYAGQLENLWNELNSLQEELCAECDDTVYEEHQEEYNLLAGRIEDLQTSIIIVPDPPVVEPAANTSSINLPKLELPTFSGSLYEWSSFFDLFTATINNNAALSGGQKLQYLKASLRGEAAHLLHSIQVTDANFGEAWEILVKRYQNRREIVNSHIKRLCSQQPIHSESPAALRSFIDTTVETIRALRVMEVAVDQWDAILVYLITEKIDSDSRREWELSLKNEDIPKFDDLVSFLEQRARALITCTNQKVRTSNKFQSTNNGIRKGPVFAEYHGIATKQTCGICKKGHATFKCSTLLDSSVMERRHLVKVHHLCFNCLSKEHPVKHCKAGNCKKCNGRHHSLLHEVTTVRFQEPPDSDPNLSAHVINNTVNNSTCCQVLLATALIHVQDVFGVNQVCRALIDSGSQATFITEACIQRLGLKRYRKNVTVSGLGLASIGQSNSASQLQVTSCVDSRFTLSIEALILKSVTGQLPSLQCNPEPWDHIKTLKLADPTFNTPQHVDILLGAGVHAEIMRSGLRHGNQGTPVAQESALGWLLSGKIKTSGKSTTIVNHFVHQELIDSVQRFWELDEVPSRRLLTPEEKSCEEHFESTHSRDKEGRFVVKLPLKSPEVTMVGTRDIAIRRLKQVERNLEKQPERKHQYHQFMKEYISLNHMEVVPPNEDAVYLPHHSVVREASSTTKLRVVFDASAKSRNGTSLNEHLMIGPTVQDNLFNILIRFRKYIVAITADICKMYRQIRVEKSETDYQRIVWRESPAHPIQDYRLLTVTYGTAAAPYLATRCLQQLARDEVNELTEAAEVVLRDFYVDDLMSGSDTVQGALELQGQLLELLKRGRFELKKWSSNRSELLESLPPSFRQTQLPLHIDKNEGIKTLGLRWNPASDEFSFSISPPSSAPATKRSVLSELSKVFDPLGWLSPITVTAKILFQQLWRTTSTWDDRVPESVDRAWTQYQTNLTAVETIRLPRTLFSKEAVSHQLHGFCDSSEKAYAAALYLRSELHDGSIEISLIAAKTKVAPIKTITLPRLELCGALLLSRLINTVPKALQLPIQEVHAWTDSTITLAWISSPPSRWKTFVANRVSEIQEIIPPKNWHHVNGYDNPADCASRGISATELSEHPLWWHGPTWLKEENQGISSQQTNIQRKTIPEQEIIKEERIVLTNIAKTEDTLLERYSSLTTVNRVTAYVLRFIHNIRSKTGERRTGPLSRNEINGAFYFWLKKAQCEEFKNDIKHLSANKPLPSTSRLLSLSPFLDNEGILRVGGRLRQSSLSVDRKFPILLPRHHLLTTMIVRYEHLRHLHAGPQLLLASLQQRFWIIGGRDVVRHFVRKCVTCCRLRAEIPQQRMGDLPMSRVNVTRPFNKCGVDYAGPFTLRAMKIRGQKTYKAYVALFVCFATRAIHLELVSDLSTDAFIAALKRFVSRRGNCDEIHSDCGSNFVGANKELKLFLKLTNKQSHNEKVARHLAEAGTLWKFNPPAAPHFGGLWEAGVKSLKFHFRRIVGNVSMTFEEMSTVLTQIEACLNSRPLCALSTDPNDLAALTPGHFLIGDALTAIPEPDYTALKLNSLSRWQLTQRMFQHFWKRWSGEYLTRLQQRPKAWSKKREIQVNDLVILKDERLPPLKWNLGRIIQVHPGSDNLVRVVTVKTAIGEYRRPVSKVCMLPISPD